MEIPESREQLRHLIRIEHACSISQLATPVRQELAAMVLAEILHLRSKFFDLVDCERRLEFGYACALVLERIKQSW